MENRNWMLMLKGNELALANIYNKYAEVLYQYGLKMTKDTVCIEDSIQDLFLYLIKNRKNLTTPTNIKFYLIRAYRNQLIKELTKKKHHLEIDSLNSIDFFVETNLETEAFNNKLPEKQRQLITELMTSLSSRQKEAVYLKYKNGFTNEEIAIIMEISDQACRNLISNAIKRMREYLSEMCISKEIILLFDFFY
jgi:RNA polymerase sigma factor (sigma-70 family)